MSRALCFLFVALAIGALLGALFVFRWPYPDFCAWALQAAGKPHYEQYLRTQLLPPGRYEILRWAALPLGALLACGFGYAAFRAATVAKTIRLGFGFFAERLLAEWRAVRSLPAVAAGVFWAVSALFLLRGIGYCQYFPLQHDECWSWLHFTSRGPLFCLFAPHNNHALYTLSDWALGPLLVGPPEIKLRAPALLAGLGGLWAFFAWARRVFGVRAALAGIVFLAFSPAYTAATLLARGYSLGFFFTLLGLAALEGMARHPQRRGFYTLFALSGIGNLMSVPSQLWALLALFFFLVKNFFEEKLSPKKQIEKSKLFWTIGAIGVATPLLYLPSMLAGGFSIGEEAVGKAETARSFSYLSSIYDNVAGIEGGWMPLWLFVVLGLSVGQMDPKVCVGAAAIWVMPVAISLMLGVAAPERIWAFVGIAPAIAVAGLVSRWMNGIKYWLLVVCFTALAFPLAVLSQRQHALEWCRALDGWCQQAVHAALRLPGEHFHTNFFYVKPRLETDLRFAHRKARVTLSASGSFDQAELDPASPPDVVLWNPEQGPFPFADRFERLFVNPQLEVWGIKK